jgi:hypothetical protein
MITCILRYVHTHMHSLTQRYSEDLSPTCASVLYINLKLLVIIKPTIAIAFVFHLLMLIHFIPMKFYCYEKWNICQNSTWNVLYNREGT